MNPPSTRDQAQYYINLILNTRPDEMKVLLLDQLTMNSLSLVCSQSKLLVKNYLYINLITHKPRERMSHLHCVVFVSPTCETSIDELVSELKSPHYKDYTIFFSHRCPLSELRDIAAADSQERVESVRELYFNFHIIDPFLSVLPKRKIIEDRKHPALSSSIANWVMINSIGVVPDIYFQKGSKISEQCAGHVHSWMTSHQSVVETELVRFLTPDQQQDVKEFKHSRNLLLIFDRRMDPVTPLLQQWTYQAMLHELFNFESNVVRIAGRYSKRDRNEEDEENEGEQEEEEEEEEEGEFLEVSLKDSFYESHKFDNWGDLCINLKEEVSKIQNIDQGHNVRAEEGGFRSIDDIRNYVDHLFLSTYQKDAKNVSNHVNIIYSLKKCIKKKNLMKISPVEQSLVCQRDTKKVLMSISKMIKPEVQQQQLMSKDHVLDRNLLLNLCFLFFLRFENDSVNKRRILKMSTKFQSLTPLEIDLIERFGIEMKEYSHPNLLFGGEGGRGSMFGDDDGTPLWKGFTFIEKMINSVSGLSDVKNVFIQHKPLIYKLVNQIVAHREPKAPFVVYESPKSRRRNINKKKKSKKNGKNNSIKKVLIYIIGGATFEENRFVHEYNMRKNRKFTLYLCGDEVLNSKKFRRMFQKNKFED